MQGYEFFPDIPALQSKTMVTDVNIINNLNGIVIRNRAAWGWTAKMRVYNRHTHQNDTHDIKVYYSMYHFDSEEEVTVPLRFRNGPYMNRGSNWVI